MAGVQPVQLYTLKVSPDGIIVPALPPGTSAMFRVTMAAIDPDARPEYDDDADTSKPARATLRIIRAPPGSDLDDEDYEYEGSDSDEDDSEDEEVNGGPSDKEKAKQRRKEAARKELEDAMDEDDEESEEKENAKISSVIRRLIKGKEPALGDDEDDEDDEDIDEAVVCTLDPEKQYQQPLDLTISEDEKVYFRVTGTHTVYLTGNYVISADDGRGASDDEDEDEDEYDLSPDEDELDIDLMDEDEESDELDDLENPRITEIHSDEEEEEPPKLIEAPKNKNKNKRPAEDTEEEKPKVNGDASLSKKQQKKLKKNNGEAAPVDTKKEEGKKETSGKSDKKVQFAEKLEQGPTPSGQSKKAGDKKENAEDKKSAKKEEDKKPAAEKTTGTLGVKEVQGVKIDDKKLGKGPTAKPGNTVSMRYIGKLEDGKVFDANKKGKPFTFKLGKGEVIKGWDIGVAGMAAGGERRITIPPHLAYGKKALPGIPPNSKLIFDVKLLEIK
ncbi:hypothetical protein VTN49DRAFT_579 [Thermomyces lanuginosus]|uniref:uncharacterized protein n=1 Tax=Thermomyces lanuginosus TaxID=5541 RepID=UPI0037424CF5